MDSTSAHRPWPPANRPWIMYQQWEDLLFAHWPVNIERLRPLIPRQLPLDTFNGTCWVGIVPFMITRLHARLTPAIPGVSDFLEMNVRTYVTMDGKAGVYFFSLDAASPLAVQAARTFFHLPYYTADMSLTKDGTVIRYSTRRRSDAGQPAELECSYQAQGDEFNAEPGSLEYFLTERYCLYTVHGGSVHRCEIDHPPWPLQKARAEFERNTMAQAAGITLPDSPPHLLFAGFQPVHIWALEQIR